MRTVSRLSMLAVLAAAPAAFAQTTVALECGVVGSGSFTQGPNDFYNFTAQAGDAIIIRTVITSADPGFAPKFNLYDPSGRQLNPRANPATVSTTVLGEFELASGGAYQLRAQNADLAITGTYKVSFTFLNRPCAPSTLTCGYGLTGQLTALLQMNTYQFSAAAWDVKSLRLTKFAPFTQGSGISVIVYSPSGRVLTGPGNQRLSGNVGASGSLRLDFAVAETGMFNILVLDRGSVANTDNYSLVVTQLNAPCSANVLSCGTVQEGRVSTVLGLDSYALTLAAGETVAVKIAVLTGSFTPFVEVYDSNGVAVRVVGLPAEGPSSLSFVFTAGSAGTHTVLVRDGDAVSTTAGYSITLVRLNRPCDATAVSCGSVVDGSIPGVMLANAYTLTASAGDIYLLRVLRNDPTAAFRPHFDIYTAQGNRIESLTVNDVGRVTFTTQADGVYTLIASDSLDRAQTGTYVFSLVRLNRPCNATALSCGAPVTGTLSRPLASSVYTYSATPGESFTVRLMDQTGALQPVLDVYNAQGVAVGSNVSGSFIGVDVTQPAGGTYTIVATDGARRSVAGPFSLALLRTSNPCAVSPPQGETRSGVITGPAPFTAYSLPVGAGDSLLVRSASFTPGFSAQMELYDPSGRRLDSQTFRLARTAAAAGNYTVIVGASGPRTGGAYAFAWQLLNNPAGTAALQCGATTSASISASNAFRYYSVNANAGDLMRLIFTRTSDNFTPQIELFDPAGVRLAASSDISQRAVSGGNYLAIVSPASSTGETGSFAVSYQRPNNPCGAVPLTCGQTTLRQVNVPGQLDTFTFNGTGGNRANLRFSPRTGNYAAFAELYDAAGARLATSSTGSLAATLPTNGAYSVLVRDRSATNVGSYRVNLQDDTNLCTADDKEAPILTLVQPTGGEVIAGASSFQIAWQSDDNVGVATHELAISTDSGNTFTTPIAANVSGNAQSYTWAVPADIAPSRTAVIRVTARDAAGNTQNAVSGPLAIIGSGFTPNSTTTYTYDAINRITQAVLTDGSTVVYTWDAAGNLVQVTVTVP